eukprot:586738-Rhodomonas_salina.2
MSAFHVRVQSVVPLALICAGLALICEGLICAVYRGLSFLARTHCGHYRAYMCAYMCVAGPDGLICARMCAVHRGRLCGASGAAGDAPLRLPRHPAHPRALPAHPGALYVVLICLPEFAYMSA